MSPIYIVIPFFVLFAIVMVAIGMGTRFLEVQRKKQVEGMLNVISGEHESDEPTILMQREGDPMDAILKKAAISKIERFILQAGLTWTVSQLVSSIVIASVIGGALGLFFNPFGFRIVSILVIATLVGSMPYWFLRHKRTKRLAEFEAEFPEALDFLARSMRAGHAFSISLEMLGQESPDPLGQEFRVLFNEQNLGSPLDAALGNFAGRVPLLDVRMFVSSVLLQKQTGGNLSEILIRLAYVIRERFRLKGQVKAASAHGRMTAIVLSVLPLVLMVGLLFVAPGYLQGMAADPDGKWMIVGAITAQGLGYYIMRRIVDIKV
jgi:tight adherence protein B